MPIKYFIDVVQTHGFTSAAKRNFVSQTAVSTAIAKLEKELGKKLINREVGGISLTDEGKQFYQLAISAIKAYDNMWQADNWNNIATLKVHFLEGMAEYASKFVEKLKITNKVIFNEESFNTSINALLNHQFDLLIGFELAFINNSNLDYVPIDTMDFDLVFNKNDADTLKEIKKKSKSIPLYLIDWNSTEISDVQSQMLEMYSQNDWAYKEVIETGSLESICLNINFSGGIAMIPAEFSLPRTCNNLVRVSPNYLKDMCKIVVAFNKDIAPDLKRKITKVAN